MRKLILLLAVLLLTATGAQAKPKISTHASQAPGATVTVVHFGANW